MSAPATSAPEAFSALRYEIAPARGGAPFLAQPMTEADAGPLAEAVSALEPWRTYAYPADKLAAYLARHQPGAGSSCTMRASSPGHGATPQLDARTLRAIPRGATALPVPVYRDGQRSPQRRTPAAGQCRSNRRRAVLAACGVADPARSTTGGGD